MRVVVFERFAVRERPIGRAELIERDAPGGLLLRRGGQLETWRVRYLDPLPEDYPHPARPEWVTIRTDADDLCTGPERVPSCGDLGPCVPA